ncbi:hypothetical protein [Nocardia brevicatena]|uniref:hypothetical protein n=1 Tax=Nocardia brevicatena TaxID=37327 RepID=UPI0012F978D5|nr:hypothetical protein [Nocardia brevicatena]
MNQPLNLLLKRLTARLAGTTDQPGIPQASGAIAGRYDQFADLSGRATDGLKGAEAQSADVIGGSVPSAIGDRPLSGGGGGDGTGNGGRFGEDDPMPGWLAEALAPIRHLRLDSPDDDLAIAVQYQHIARLADTLTPFSPPMNRDAIARELSHSARSNWSRINAGQFELHAAYLALRSGDNAVELSVYPFWDKDFRQGLRGLGLTGRGDPPVAIDDLANSMITAVENRKRAT